MSAEVRRTRPVAAIAGLAWAVVSVAAGAGGCGSGKTSNPEPTAPAATSSATTAAQATVTFTFASPGTTSDTRNHELSIIKARIASEKLTGTTAGLSPDGKGIVVQGPDADNDQMQLLGRTGVLQFRPVLIAQSTKSPTDGPRPQGVSPAEWTDFANLDCPNPAQDLAAAQVFACQSDDSQKFILEATAVSGTSVVSADAARAGTGATWQVTLSLTAQGAAQFGQLTSRLAGTSGQIAITVDGIVYSAPVVQEAIPGGEVQISGDIDQYTAQNLATMLKTGALPVPLRVAGTTGTSGRIG